MHTSCPRRASCTALWLNSTLVTRPIEMFLLGTHSGVPSRRMPPSTMTPQTIGSRLLKMYCGRMRSFAGNTARCLNFSWFAFFRSSLSGKWHSVFRSSIYTRKKTHPASPVLDESIEEMVDDVGSENCDTQRVRHFLRLAFNLDVEGQDHGPLWIPIQHGRRLHHVPLMHRPNVNGSVLRSGKANFFQPKLWFRNLHIPRK